MNPAAFEAEVHRIASVLYPGDPYGGPTMVDGREHDGTYVTEDVVVVVEATTSAAKVKAEKDGRKLKTRADVLSKRYPYKAIKAYFVTQAEPTADQMDAIRKIGPPVTAISYARLRENLIDSRGYLTCRTEARFGSARDPETDLLVLRDRYVPLDFTDVDRRTEQYDHRGLAEKLGAGCPVVIVGDFGTGKSMTLREVFLEFRKRHLANMNSQFCVHLNLNEHQGQKETSEALIRHATTIGFEHPSQLVKAWRAGQAHIILDGFDEIFLTGISAGSHSVAVGTGSRPIADVRYQTAELVRKFLAEKSPKSGILIAGREHYFDSVDELKSSLALPQDALVVSASDFTEEQVRTYLKNRNWEAELPDWLPRRPLIVGYFAARRLHSLVEGFEHSEPGEGWDTLLDRICVRESRMEAGIECVVGPAPARTPCDLRSLQREWPRSAWIPRSGECI